MAYQQPPAKRRKITATSEPNTITLGSVIDASISRTNASFASIEASFSEIRASFSGIKTSLAESHKLVEECVQNCDSMTATLERINDKLDGMPGGTFKRESLESGMLEGKNSEDGMLKGESLLDIFEEGKRKLVEAIHKGAEEGFKDYMEVKRAFQDVEEKQADDDT